MTQVSILSGVKTDSTASVIEALPINLEPSLTASGISNGNMKCVAGMSLFAASSIGQDRAAINWNDTLYRVQGSRLISINELGNIIDIGDVGNNGEAVFLDYGFDRLAIASNDKLYYWDGVSLTLVTDPNFGIVKSVIWVDGYYLTTDGVSIVNSLLADPTTANPTSYGSAELDPDGIQGLIKINDEPGAVGRYTIQWLQNVGGSGFPFANIKSAFVTKGAVGPEAFCEFAETLAFCGSGKDEALGVFLLVGGKAQSITTPAIEKELQALTLEQQALIKLEKIVYNKEERLLVHLPTKTLVFNYNASQANQSPVWVIYAGGILADQAYPLRNFVFVYNKYIGAVETTGNIGYLDPSVNTHFGETVGWLLTSDYLFEESGFTATEVELTATTGRTPIGVNPTIFMSYSKDGINYSQEKAIPQGAQGQTTKKLVWRPMVSTYNYMCFRFRGANTSIASLNRLDVTTEAMDL